MPDQTFVRAFPTTLEQKEPRVVTGRLVPYDTPTDVVDFVDGKPTFYREGFRRGAFGRQSGSTEPGVFGRIGFIHKHDGGLGFLGPFIALREADDGLWGDARVLRSKAADLEDLLESGVRELSVEFRVGGRAHTTVDADGVQWRTRAHLDAVALEAKGAYTGAQVVAFRAAMDDEDRDDDPDDPEKDDDELTPEEKALAAAAADAAEEEEAKKARRAAWDALTARLDTEKNRQDLYIRDFGLTLPNHAR